MHDVLLAAVGAGGSTLGDNQYVDLMGVGGSYQDDHRVYGRAGERCPTCGRGRHPPHRHRRPLDPLLPVVPAPAAARASLTADRRSSR